MNEESGFKVEGDLPQFESEAEKADFLFQTFGALAQGIEASPVAIGVVGINILVVMLGRCAEDLDEALKGVDAVTKDLVKGLKRMFEVQDQ